MVKARIIGAWLILLLFVSGMVSPFVPAAQAVCPMQAAMQKMHCQEAKPAPTVPACCQKHEAMVIAPTSAISAGCCCHLKAAPDRPEVPATIPVPSVVAVLPALPVTLALPQTVAVAVIAPFTTDENAPRGPPRVLCSPRAPPLS